MNEVDNIMTYDAYWEGVEMLQMRTPDRHSRRLQQIIDEMEYGRLEEEKL